MVWVGFGLSSSCVRQVLISSVGGLACLHKETSLTWAHNLHRFMFLFPRDTFCTLWSAKYPPVFWKQWARKRQEACVSIPLRDQSSCHCTLLWHAREQVGRETSWVLQQKKLYLEICSYVGIKGCKMHSHRKSLPWQVQLLIGKLRLSICLPGRNHAAKQQISSPGNDEPTEAI